ncbi:NERD domain-containing protein [Nocardioides jishulii]|uniref:NERD domain-containing protein n=2 Tax=Nocardioides jishulii TaxID=2575440 RepID=A0A4U2YU10_9ACTN|nr:NERD domain-containing protein [Nocardioides jishulii]TKI64909.1 NERD domain-containing protein [Nocardioides jishulii]
MKLRYAGVCRVCSADLPAKTPAIYERSTKTVRCVEHAGASATDEPAEARVTVPDPASTSEPTVPPTPEPVIDTGTAGASARREFERRKQRREDRVREKHPKIGGLLLALSDDPQTTTAWNTGALGEERLGAGLDSRGSEQLRLLHDRRIPRSRANIDHLAVTPTGVYVIDAKKYAGRPHLEVEGGILRPRVEKLLVGRRDCTKVVDGVLKQIEVVKGVLGDSVPVHGVLCFVEADWPLIGGSFTTREVAVLWPRKLYSRLAAADGPLDAEAIAAAHQQLARALPPA